MVLQINLDQTKLDAYGLDNKAVLFRPLRHKNVGGLIGVALDDGEIRMLYLGNKINQLDEIASLPVYFDNTNVIKLSDLTVAGGIKYINANTNVYSKINGVQGIQVSFTKQSNYGITESSQLITNRLDEIMAREGIDANYEVLLDQGEYINQSISSVFNQFNRWGLTSSHYIVCFLKRY